MALKSIVNWVDRAVAQDEPISVQDAKSIGILLTTAMQEAPQFSFSPHKLAGMLATLKQEREVTAQSFRDYTDHRFLLHQQFGEARDAIRQALMEIGSLDLQRQPGTPHDPNASSSEPLRGNGIESVKDLLTEKDAKIWELRKQLVNLHGRLAASRKADDPELPAIQDIADLEEHGSQHLDELLSYIPEDAQDAARAIISRLTVDVEQARAAERLAESEADNLRLRMSEMASAALIKQHGYEELSNFSQEIAKELRCVRDENQALKLRLAEPAPDVVHADDEHELLTADIQQLRASLELAQTELFNAADENHQLQQQLSFFEEKVATLTDQLVEQLDDKDAQLLEVIAEKKALVESHDALQEELHVKEMRLVREAEAKDTIAVKLQEVEADYRTLLLQSLTHQRYNNNNNNNNNNNSAPASPVKANGHPRDRSSPSPVPSPLQHHRPRTDSSNSSYTGLIRERHLLAEQQPGAADCSEGQDELSRFRQTESANSRRESSGMEDEQLQAEMASLRRATAGYQATIQEQSHELQSLVGKVQAQRREIDRLLEADERCQQLTAQLAEAEKNIATLEAESESRERLAQEVAATQAAEAGKESDLNIAIMQQELHAFMNHHGTIVRAHGQAIAQMQANHDRQAQRLRDKLHHERAKRLRHDQRLIDIKEQSAGLARLNESLYVALQRAQNANASVRRRTSLILPGDEGAHTNTETALRRVISILDRSMSGTELLDGSHVPGSDQAGLVEQALTLLRPVAEHMSALGGDINALHELQMLEEEREQLRTQMQELRESYDREHHRLLEAEKGLNVLRQANRQLELDKRSVNTKFQELSLALNEATARIGDLYVENTRLLTELRKEKRQRTSMDSVDLEHAAEAANATAAEHTPSPLPHEASQAIIGPDDGPPDDASPPGEVVELQRARARLRARLAEVSGLAQSEDLSEADLLTATEGRLRSTKNGTGNGTENGAVNGTCNGSQSSSPVDAAASSDITESNSNSNASIQEMQVELEAYKQTIRKLEDENKHLLLALTSGNSKAVDADVTQLHEENQGMHEQLRAAGSAPAHNGALDATAHQLEADKAKLAEQLEEALRAGVVQRDRLARLEAENVRLQDVAAAAAELTAENNRLSALLEQEQDVTQDLETTMETGRRQFDTVVAEQAALLQQQALELEHARKDMEQLQQAALDFETQLGALQAQLTTAEQDRDAEAAQAALLRDALTKLTNQADGMKGELLRELGESKTRYESQVERLRQQNHKLQRDLVDLRSSTDTLIADKDEELDSATGQLQELYDQQMSNRREQDRHVKELEEQAQAARRELDVALAENEQLRGQLLDTSLEETPAIKASRLTGSPLRSRDSVVNWDVNDMSIAELQLVAEQVSEALARHDPEQAPDLARLQTELQQLQRASQTWPLFRALQAIPRPAGLEPLPPSPSRPSNNKPGPTDPSEKRYWIAKVEELTQQMQQSSSFWSAKVRAATTNLDTYQEACHQHVERAAAAYQHMVDLLLQLCQAMLRVTSTVGKAHTDRGVNTQVQVALNVAFDVTQQIRRLANLQQAPDVVVPEQ